MGLTMAVLSPSLSGARSRNGTWSEEDATQALAHRGLRPETIRTFEITPVLLKNAWRFPIGEGAKYKRFEPGDPKYWWDGGKPAGADVYGLDLLPPGSTSHVFLVEGEADLWVAHQAGLKALTFTCGAGTVPKAAVRALVDAKITSVTVVYDNDEAGHSGAQKAARALHEAGLDVEVRDLPHHMPPGSDLTDLYNVVGRDDAAFCKLVSELAMVAVEEDACEIKKNARPTIQVREKLTAVTEEAIEALAAQTDLCLYVRGRRLVTVARDGSAREKWLTRPPGSPAIVPLEPARLLGMLDAAAGWNKWNATKHDLVPARPPDWVAAQILARPEWPFPYLEAILEMPTMRPDGSILETPGYDDATGILYERIPGSPHWPGVPERLTVEDARQAVELLLGLVADFPFVADSDRAAYVAALMTLVVRHLIEGPVPMFPIRAPTPGTGKGLLAAVIVLIGTGREPAIMTMPKASEELRKRITSLVIAGTPCVNLDNVSGTLGSDVLAAALTSSEWEDRILGRSEMVRLPNRLVWLATGNNFGFGSTLGRRVVPIDLDAELENPEDRADFKQPDLLRHVRRYRGRYVAATLTILRAFHLAGRPAHGGSRVGSFEDWDDLIRSAVIWSGVDDPAGSGDPTRGRGRVRAAADTDVDELVTLLEALSRVFTVERFTATEALQRAEGDDELRRDLDAAAGDRKTGKATSHSLAYALRSANNRPVGSLTLRADSGKRPRRYRIEVKGR